MWWLILLVVVAVCIGVWLFLHRDPDIEIRRFDGYLSPADGLVADIIAVRDKKVAIPKKHHGITAFLTDAPWAKTIVVIMMRPEHIHTQRAPTDGRVSAVVHKSGTLKNAVFGDYRLATVENEHVAFTFSGKRPCKVYLIAGLLARRIKPRVIPNQLVAQGDRIGSIAFGSQVALVLPQCTLLVKEGQRVHVGATKVAR